MSSTNDIIRIVALGTYLNQEISNVFFYKIGAGSTGALIPEAWLTDWATLFEFEVLASLATSLTYNRLVFDNLTDGLEFADVVIDINGGRLGDPLPSSVAMGVKLARTTKVTRNGSKRYPGITEETGNGNSIILTQPAIDLIEGFHTQVLNIPDYDGAGGNLNLLNVIVGRTKNLEGVYELDLTKVNTVSDAEVKAQLTTQNSRKP